MSLKLSWATEKRIVNVLVPLSINPRKITEEKKNKLIQLIEKFNLVEIPAINLDNTLISGHQRCKAMQAIGRGEEEIDVRVPNRLLLPDEIKEYNLASNTHAGEFDFDLLDEYFKDIDLESFDIAPPVIIEEEVTTEEDAKPKKKKTEKELKLFQRTHVLLSFPPEKILELKEPLDRILALGFVEYVQSSN